MLHENRNFLARLCAAFLLLLSAGLQAAPTAIPVGGSLQGIALNPATNTAYVAALGTTSVTMINMATNTVAGQINLSLPVGNSVARLAMNSQTSRLYLLNFNRISIIDTRRNAWLQDVSLGAPPNRINTSDIAVNPATDTVYVSVTSSENGALANALYYMNGDGTGIGSIALSQSILLNYVAVDATNNRVYVTDMGGNVVHVVDGATKTLIGSTTSLPSRIGKISANPATGLAYAGMQGHAPAKYPGGVNVVGVSNKAVSQNFVAVGNYTNAMSNAVSPLSNVVFVADGGGWQVAGTGIYMLNGATNQVIGLPFPAGFRPLSLAFNDSSSTLYALSGDQNGIVTAVPVPRIDGISPAAAGAGQTLTLTGLNFDTTAANNQVIFTGGATAIPTAATATSLTVVLPAGAASGPVSIVTGGITSPPSAPALTVLQAPVIDALSSYVTVPGSTLVITGANFGARAADNSVQFSGGLTVTPTQADATSLLVTIPATARSGPIRITSNGLQSAPSARLTLVKTTTVTSPTRLPLFGVTAGQAGYVAVGEQGTTLFSADGLGWTANKAISVYRLGGVCHGNGKYFASSGPIGGRNGSEVVSSSDGRNWKLTNVANISPYCAGWSVSEMYVGTLIGYSTASSPSGLGISPDGLQWDMRLNTGNAVFRITTGESNYLASGSGTTVYTSPDGMQWTAATISGATQLYRVAWSPSLRMYAALANNPQVISTSHDGTLWTMRRGSTGLPTLDDLVWNETLGLFLAGGRTGGLVASNDGINWSILPTTGSIYGLASNGKNFVGVGNNGSLVLLTVQ